MLRIICAEKNENESKTNMHQRIQHVEIKDKLFKQSMSDI